MNLFNDVNNLIKDIRNREEITLIVKIQAISIQKTTSGTDYLNLTISDQSGQMNAKKWNVSEEEKSLFKIGEIIRVTGVGSEYNQKLQFIIEHMQKVDPKEGIDVSQFYEHAPVAKEVLKDEILAAIEKMNNSKIKKITNYLFRKYEEKFLTFPAATRNHHAYISGLAHHVVTMLKLANSLSQIYPQVNIDLLRAGVILHDLGKVMELSNPMTPEYTTHGTLIGHINICFEEIRLAALTLNIEGEEVMLLQHLVLSHHGQLEYGSPKQPLILEAELLHMIDLIDSRVNMISSDLDEVEDHAFTKRIYSLEGRAFYKHQL